MKKIAFFNAIFFKKLNDSLKIKLNKQIEYCQKD